MSFRDGAFGYPFKLSLTFVLLNLCVLLLTGFGVYQSYREHQHEAQLTTSNLALVLERNLTHLIQRVEIALYGLGDYYENQSKHAPDIIDQQIEQVRSRLQEVEAIRITDADGLLIHGTGVEAGKKVSLADRSHFIQLKEQPDLQLAISEPQKSRVNDQWVLALAQRLTTVDGRFDGMIFATVTLEYLNNFFAGIDLGPNGIVSLRNFDLRFIARHSSPAGYGKNIGDQYSEEQSLAWLASGQAKGRGHLLMAFDDRVKTVAFQRVDSYPLFVTVGMDREDYLAEWRLMGWHLGLLVGLFLLASLMAELALLRAWRRQQLQAQLAEQRLRLMEGAHRQSLQKLLVATLDEAEAITGSQSSWYCFFEADQQRLRLMAWSSRTPGQYRHAETLDFTHVVHRACLLAEVVQRHQAVIRNDLRQTEGTLDESEVLRDLIVPVSRQGRVVAILRLANKASPYRLADLQAVMALADLAWDLVEKKRLEAELVELANTDSLTGLDNRRYFLSKLNTELDRLGRFEIPLAAVLMLDFDHFKKINDHLGHAAGDAVLRHCAALMRDSLRKIDSCGRLGGEEFCILLLGSDIAAAQAFGERLRQKIANNPCQYEQDAIQVTVSIGITSLHQTDTQASDVLSRADRALYRAKTLGRNRCELELPDADD
jgi:diguanylate cyclase (GGDEF)-like protein